MYHDKFIRDSGSDEAGGAKWEPGSGSIVGSDDCQQKGVGSGESVSVRRTVGMYVMLL